MALNVCNWSDKQLDELADMLKSADYSAVATFIANNFLCAGSRIMEDNSSSTLRASVGVDKKTIVLSAGVFVHAGKCSQLDSNQVVNILDTATGSWGTGQIADASPRYDIICVKNNDQANTPANRWFVDDSTVPNTYSIKLTNTLINKAYYDIVVVHGTPGSPPAVPAAPPGYWAITEIYIPDGTTALDGAGVVIQDTTGISVSTVGPEAGGKNWIGSSRVLRMEFWATKFNVDHDPVTGYHRSGGWHIGSTLINVTGAELNQALDGIAVPGTVTAAHLTKLTDGSSLAPGELHVHGGAVNFLATAVRILSNTTGPVFDWTDIDLSAYLPASAKVAYVTLDMLTICAPVFVGVASATGLVRPKGSAETVYLPKVNGMAPMAGILSWWTADWDTNTCFVGLGPGRIIQAKWAVVGTGLGFGGAYGSHFYIDLLGYI
jgi:hypothetical protein